MLTVRHISTTRLRPRVHRLHSPAADGLSHDPLTESVLKFSQLFPRLLFCVQTAGHVHALPWAVLSVLICDGHLAPPTHTYFFHDIVFQEPGSAVLQNALPLDVSDFLSGLDSGWAAMPSAVPAGPGMLPPCGVDPLRVR